MDESKKEAHELEPVLERLCESYGLLPRRLFAQKLVDGEFQILALPHRCYALFRWKHDKIFEILTCTGAIDHAETALHTIECYARSTGAKAITGLARWGWKPLLDQRRYETGTRLIFFRKEL